MRRLLRVAFIPSGQNLFKAIKLKAEYQLRLILCVLKAKYSIMCDIISKIIDKMLIYVYYLLLFVITSKILSAVV